MGRGPPEAKDFCTEGEFSPPGKWRSCSFVNAKVCFYFHALHVS